MNEATRNSFRDLASPLIKSFRPDVMAHASSARPDDELDGRLAARRHKPDLRRVEPDRRYRTLLFGASNEEGRKNSERKRAREEGPPSVVADAVETAYRVVEGYMRRGRAEAARFSSVADSNSERVDDWQDVAGRLATESLQLFDRMFETMDLIVRSGFDPIRDAERTHDPPSDAPASSPDPESIVVSCAQGAIAILEVDLKVPDLESSRLHSQAGEMLPQRLGLTRSSDGEQLIVAASAPLDQAPGSYFGLLVDPEGRQIAAVEVKVTPASAQ